MPSTQFNLCAFLYDSMKKLVLFLFIYFTLFFAIPVFANNNSIIITKVQVSGDKAKDEFIQIFNPTQTSIDLENWKLYKKTKSGSASNLITKFEKITIPANEFLIITPTEAQLTNVSPDIFYSTQSSLAKNNAVILEDDEKNIIDSLAWGENSFGFGEPTENPDNFITITRKKDNDNIFIHTNDNKNDFELITNEIIDTEIPDTTEENLPEGKPEEELIIEQEVVVDDIQPSILPSSILINEFYPAPLPGEEEWIELYNNSNTHLILEGCFIEEASGAKTELKNKIPAREYLLVTNPKGSLNNDKDSITLICKNTIIDQIAYGTETSILPPEKGNSIAKENELLIHTSFKETIIITPSEKNIISPPLQEETIEKIPVKEVISMEPSMEETLPTEPELSKKIQGKPLLSKPTLIVQAQEPPEQSETNHNKEPITAIQEEKSEKNQEIQQKDSETLNTNLPPIITEFMPNPIGNDSAEWIELFNPHEERINLKQWNIEDKSGKKYTFNDFFIEPFSYTILHRKQSNLNLNNTNEALTLFSPAGEIKQEIQYEISQENQSWSLNSEKSWELSITPTPLAENIITKEKESTKKSTTKSATQFKKFTGFVSVLPNKIYKNSIFIEPSGYQIYLSKESFPQELKIGNTIEITGKLNNKKITLSKSSQLQIISSNTELQIPELDLTEIDPSFHGNVITTKGYVLNKTNKLFYLGDPSMSIQVAPKTNTQLIKTLHDGDIVSVTGVVLKTKDTFKIVPFEKNYLEIVEKSVIIPETNEIIPSDQTEDKEIISLKVILYTIILGLTGTFFYYSRKQYKTG